MADTPWERRSMEGYERVAEIAAEKAVAQTFSALGVDVHKQSDLNDLRDVLLHARKMQKLSERAGVLAFALVCTAIISGALTFMWSGFTSILRHYHG